MTRPHVSVDEGRFLENSTFYQEYLAEKNEVLRHKWIESEKAGFDIGFEKALIHWMLNHRSQWRKSRNLVKGMS